DRAIALRDDFLSIASHELRTPLTALKLNVQLALRRQKPGEAGGTEAGGRPTLESLVRQADRLANLVDTMLDVTRIRAGRIVLELEDLDLGGLIRDIAPRFEAEAS